MQIAKENLFSKIKCFGDMVMFRHTLFSLPFVFIGMLLAQRGLPHFHKLVWILLALLGARNGANALNRLVDCNIDAVNPRTAGRHLPSGILHKKDVLLFVGICFAVFIYSTYMLNPLCVMLLPVPLFLFSIYSYTKRFTWLCHFILGAAIGGAPMGGWLAIKGQIQYPEIIVPFMLWMAVGLWVAGFDIIYAVLDYEFDVRNGIFSVPARFGINGALRISSAAHLASILILYFIPLFYPLTWIYFIAVTLTAGLLIYEHLIVSPDNVQNVKIASYNVNEIVGLVILCGVILEVL